MTKADTVRQDGYQNAVIGHGIKKLDPMANYRFSLDMLMDDQLLAALYAGNRLAARVVDLPADEAVKNWITIDGDTDELAIQMLDDLDAEVHYADAIRWARLYGGSGILIVADDGGLLEQPLNENNLRKIEELRVYDRTQIWPDFMSRYQDPQNPKFNKPEFFEIYPVEGGQFRVHESRLQLFTGNPVPSRYYNQFWLWGFPALQGLWDELLHYAQSHKNAALIVERLSQAIYKFKQLAETLASADGDELVKKRMELVDIARHLLNTIVIDGEEDFDLKNIPLTNLPEMLDRFGLALSAVSGIPFTVLFGRSPAGMNATGKSDLENWYDLIRQIQKRQLKKPLDRLVRLLMICKEGLFKGRQPEMWKVEFKPLWLPSDKEQAETDKIKAEAKEKTANERNTYVGMGALDPSEVRAKLVEEGEYEIDQSLKLGGEVDDDVDPVQE